MRKIIIINGGAGVGKDTFVRLCQNIDPTIQNLSSVDYVREVAHELGWSGEKDDKARRFLSDLKKAMMLYNGAPFYKVFETINDFDENATVFLNLLILLFVLCILKHIISRLKKDFVLILFHLGSFPFVNYFVP